MTNSVRWNWIDYIKGICMLMVIMSHSNWPYWYARFFIPVFLTGFFFVSGYTFSRKRGFGEFFRAKVKSLVVPILCLGSINAVLATVAEGKTLLDRLWGLVIQRSGQWDDLWFVACLFTMEILFYVIVMVGKSSNQRMGICVLLSVIGYFYIYCGGIALPWHLDTACVLILFLGLGNWFREWKYRERFLLYISSSKGWMWMILAMVGYSISVLVCNNRLTDVHLRQYHVFSMFIISAILGIVTLIVLTIRMEKYSSLIILKTISFIGQNTLIYYAFQFKAIRLVGLIGERFFSSSTYVGNILYCILVSVVLVIPSLIINRYFPFCIGKSVGVKQKKR